MEESIFDIATNNLEAPDDKLGEIQLKAYRANDHINDAISLIENGADGEAISQAVAELRAANNLIY